MFVIKPPIDVKDPNTSTAPNGNCNCGCSPN